MKMHANLRVCASCEWIFRQNEIDECPKCGFGHYGARSVYGKKCYTYEDTQKPWFDKKMLAYEMKLNQEIREARREDADLKVHDWKKGINENV